MRKIDRFLQYLDYKGITENRATVDCELSKGLLGQAKSGKSDLGAKAVEKVLRFYQDLSRVWLLTGEGEMLNTYINKDEPPTCNKPLNPSADQKENNGMIGTLLTLVESQRKDIETLIQIVKDKDEKIDELLGRLEAREKETAQDAGHSSSVIAG